MIKERDELQSERDNALKRFQEAERVSEDWKTTSDRLKEEASNFKQQLEASEKRVSDLTRGVNSAEEENKSLSSKVSKISGEIQQAQNTIQDLISELEEMKEKYKEKESKHSSFLELHETHKRESSSHVKELEAQVESSEKLVGDLNQSLRKAEDENKLLSQRVSEISNENTIQELMSECDEDTSIDPALMLPESDPDAAQEVVVMKDPPKTRAGVKRLREAFNKSIQSLLAQEIQEETDKLQAEGHREHLKPFNGQTSIFFIQNEQGLF